MIARFDQIEQRSERLEPPHLLLRRRAYFFQHGRCGVVLIQKKACLDFTAEITPRHDVNVAGNAMHSDRPIEILKMIGNVLDLIGAQPALQPVGVRGLPSAVFAHGSERRGVG